MTTRNQLKRGHHESVLFNLEGDTRRLSLQKVIRGEEAAACNCSVYSYHSVVRFGSALHQKHLRWAPEHFL